MADFGKINPEKAQAIIQALKDGQIKPEEMKKLGLTAEEAKALTEAFSAGAVEVGDFVLINKGRVKKDGKTLQLSQTLNKSQVLSLESNTQKRAEIADRISKRKEEYGSVIGGLLSLADGFRYNMIPEKDGQVQAGFGLGKAVVAVALAASTVISCAPENKVEVEQRGSTVATIVLPNNTEMNELLKQILKRLDSIDNNNAANFKAILEKLQGVINNQYNTQASMEATLNSMFGEIKNWLQQIINNQVTINTDNNKNAQDIMKLLVEIMNSNKSIDEKLSDIMKLLGHIISVGESILEAINKAKDELLTMMGDNNKEVINVLNKLDQNDQKTLEVLNDIKALIKKYGDAGINLGEAILVAIGKVNVNVDMDKVIALLEKLLEGQNLTNISLDNMTNILTEFKAKNEEQLNVIIAKLDKINALLEKLGGDVNVGMNAILNAITELDPSKFEAKLDAILAKMDALIGKTTENGHTLVEILNKIKDIQNNISIVIEGDRIKVSCNCGCGGSHEGIIGDLENLLN